MQELWCWIIRHLRSNEYESSVQEIYYGYEKARLFTPAIIALAIILAVALAATRTPPEQSQEERPAVLVDAMEVTPQDIRFQVASQGTVEPRHQTTLVAEVGGRVMELADDFVAGGFSKKATCWYRSTHRIIG